jgi:hypothetical protein
MTSNKLENFCICLVDSVESMMMHGLANPKKYILNTAQCTLLFMRFKACTATVAAV